MSIAKRLNAKYGTDASKVKGDDRLVLNLLESFADGYVPPPPKPPPKRVRKPKNPTEIQTEFIP